MNAAPDRIAAARQYAAEARARNMPPCQCPACIQAELLPAVIQITQRWPMPRQKVRRVK